MHDGQFGRNVRDSLGVYWKNLLDLLTYDRHKWYMTIWYNTVFSYSAWLTLLLSLHRELQLQYPWSDSDCCHERALRWTACRCKASSTLATIVAENGGNGDYRRSCGLWTRPKSTGFIMSELIRRSNLNNHCLESATWLYSEENASLPVNDVLGRQFQYNRQTRPSAFSEELISYRYSSCCSCSFCWEDLLKKA